MTMLVRGGATGSAGSALPATATTGQVLQWNGSAWVAATPSASGTTPNATTAAPGLVQLAGDLAGTATAPTVAKINGATPAPVATSGSYGDLTGRPLLAPVATSGSYTDLSNKPTIPAAPSKPTILTDTGVTGTVYWRTAEGVVTVILNTAAGAAFTNLGALPAGYRPTTAWYFPVHYVNGATVTPGTLQVSPGNGLLQQDGVARTGYTAYATFSFVAA